MKKIIDKLSKSDHVKIITSNGFTFVAKSIIFTYSSNYDARERTSFDVTLKLYDLREIKTLKKKTKKKVKK